MPVASSTLTATNLEYTSALASEGSADVFFNLSRGKTFFTSLPSAVVTRRAGSILIDGVEGSTGDGVTELDDEPEVEVDVDVDVDVEVDVDTEGSGDTGEEGTIEDMAEGAAPYFRAETSADRAARLEPKEWRMANTAGSVVARAATGIVAVNGAVGAAASADGSGDATAEAGRAEDAAAETGRAEDATTAITGTGGAADLGAAGVDGTIGWVAAGVDGTTGFEADGAGDAGTTGARDAEVADTEDDAKVAEAEVAGRAKVGGPAATVAEEVDATAAAAGVDKLVRRGDEGAPLLALVGAEDFIHHIRRGPC